MACPCKELDKVSHHDVVSFYIASTLLIEQRVCQLARSMNITRFSDLEIVSFSPHSSHRTALATCSLSGNIKLAVRTLLKYECIDIILIHELCHLVHHNHTAQYWLFFESKLKELGYVESVYDGWNHRFDKSDYTWDNDFAYNVNFSTFSGSCNRKIAIVKYKIYDKASWDGKLLLRYDNKPIFEELCKQYAINIGRFQLIIH